MKKINKFLFGNAGKILKRLAVWFFWLEVICAVICACLIFVYDIQFLYFLSVIAGAWLTNLCMYGIGEAIENSAAILAKLNGDIEASAEKSAASKYAASNNAIKPPVSPIRRSMSYSGLKDIINTALRFKADEGALNYVADKLDRMSAEERLKFEPMMPFVTQKKSEGFKDALAKFAENL